MCGRAARRYPPAVPTDDLPPESPERPDGADDGAVPEDELQPDGADAGAAEASVDEPDGPELPDSSSAARLQLATLARRNATPPAATTADNSTLVRRVAVMVGIIAAVSILYFGKDLLLPIALAVMLSFLLAPVCEYLENRHVPRAVSVVAVIVAALLVILAVGYGMWTGVSQLGDDLPRYQKNLLSKIDRLPLRGGGGGRLSDVQNTFQDLNDRFAELADESTTRPATGPASEPATKPATTRAAAALEAPVEMGPGVIHGPAAAVAVPPAAAEKVRQQLAEAQRLRDEQAAEKARLGGSAEHPIFARLVEVGDSTFDRLASALGSVAGPLGTAGIVLVFALFILLDRDELRDRVIKLTAGSRLNLATQALDDASTRISSYLRAQCIVNGTYGIAVGLALTGLSYALHGELFPSIWLWALLTALLRFIPYLGPWIGASFPVIVSLGHWPGYDMFVGVLLTFVVIELISNNVMEPMLYGRSTGMSETAIILAATFWAFVWGPVGLLLATPLTTVVVVLGKYVPALRFFDVLLGDEPVLTPQSRLYQRLLALDADDAEDVVEEYREDHTLTETFDDVMLPALALAERDRHAGNLTDERVAFLRKSMRDILVTVGNQTEAKSADSVDVTEPIPADAPARQARVVLIPAGDDADELVAMMLKDLLDRRGYETTVLDDEELASEKLGQVFARHADVVVVSALPPRAVAQARYLVKRLGQAQQARGQEGDGTGAAAIVGLWTITSDRERAASRVGAGSSAMNVKIVTTLAEAADAVRQRAEAVSTRRAADANRRNAAPH